MATKLARQMALKKKLEEEYREANERLNESLKLSRARKYHSMSFDFDYQPKHSIVEIRERNMIQVEEEVDNNPKDEEKPVGTVIVDIEMRTEDISRVSVSDHEDVIEETDHEIKSDDDERLRLELKLKEEENNKRRTEEVKRRKMMREKLKRAEAKRRKEKAEKREFEEIRMFIGENNDEDVERQKALQQAQVKELEKNEEQIRKLEMSIATLDMELERFDLEEMRNRTKKVVKRMSLVMKDSEEDPDEHVDFILQSSTVKGFMQDKQLWGKYVRHGSAAN